jgi:5-carboxymethyl-2-hydroxymuconate isomerase
MPHMVILYTATLDRPAAQGGADMSALCRALADTMIAQRDEAGLAVFPVGGVRVLAYPAAHHAVADGGVAGRSAVVHQQVGEALTACARAHFAPLLATRHLGITLQVDEGPEVFDAKTSTLHPLFQPPKA